MISPRSLQMKCSLNPWHHPIVPFPSVARPAKTLLAYLEEHPALQFHEAVVGYRIREVALEVDADEVKVVVLEIVECAKMEHNQNRHNLAVGHAGSTTAASLPVGGQKRHIFNFLIKFLTEFIHSTENFCNFVVGNHEYILLFDFISDWNSDIKVQKISQITLPTDALRIYFNLCIIKYFLNIISPNNDMKAKVDALLSAYPSIDITAMGFPRGWESEPLWQ